MNSQNNEDDVLFDNLLMSIFGTTPERRQLIQSVISSRPQPMNLPRYEDVAGVPPPKYQKKK